MNGPASRHILLRPMAHALTLWSIGFLAGSLAAIAQASPQLAPVTPVAPSAIAPSGPKSSPQTPSIRDSTNVPALKTLGPGLLEIGGVQIDQRQRTASFPAVLNKTNGIMEYLLVTSYGKTHESVLKTDVSPMCIHVAMLLLDAKGSGTNTPSSQPNEYGGAPGTVILGDPVSIEILWREKDQEVKRKAEELVAIQTTHASMTNGQWRYNGSVLWQGKFLAQQSGSLISLIADPIALINVAQPDGPNAMLWTADADKLPPETVPLQVQIKLLGSQVAKPKP